MQSRRTGQRKKKQRMDKLRRKKIPPPPPLPFFCLGTGEPAVTYPLAADNFTSSNCGRKTRMEGVRFRYIFGYFIVHLGD